MFFSHRGTEAQRKETGNRVLTFVTLRERTKTKRHNALKQNTLRLIPETLLLHILTFAQ